MLTKSQAQVRADTALRHDWTPGEVRDLFTMPFNDLLYRAQTVHRGNFDANEIQLSALLNIKEGGCPEDCGYCSQSARHDTEISPGPLMPLAEIVEAAQEARTQGATRFCMGAAWRSPRERDFQRVLDTIRAVRDLGMETCATLGMLSAEQALRLKEAGLDYYNHNLDTSAAYYEEIITTRTYQDRLQTLEHVRNAGLNVCCGGIIGMGEGPDDRGELLRTLANLPQHPESVPINLLIPIEGTPLADVQALDPFEIVRTIAVARIMMPSSYVRLSAGRTDMSDTQQALCFLAGANSIFYGDRLLTADNPEHTKDVALFRRLGLRESREVRSDAPAACAHH